MITYREFRIKKEYVCTVDAMNDNDWNSVITLFKDATINQTVAWCSTMSKVTSNLVIRRKGSIIAAAMLRIVKIPILNAGIAYIGAGPMWRLIGADDDIDILRNLIHALREEYVSYRGLVLRITSNIFTNDIDYQGIIHVFEQENYKRRDVKGGTLFIDMNQSLDLLRANFHSNWRSCLNKAEQNKLVIFKGTDHKTFLAFRSIYKEMVERKKYAMPVDIGMYEKVFLTLPDSLKPVVIICESEGIPCAGVVISTIGETAIPWLLASSSKGRECFAAYLVQWEVLKMLKQLGIPTYDLGGCDLAKNYNTYLFKYRMVGKKPIVHSNIGIMESYSTLRSRLAVKSGDNLIHFYHWIKD
jgi:lipid II:glycine glycyltransferase (peptidoglycan interpeptide bridge formation enzyme)